jgi:serine/threonine-protein kinase RsbW
MATTASDTRLLVLRVPGVLAYRDIAMRVVSGACKLAGSRTELSWAADEAFYHQFVSAFGEAFNNVVLHGYRGIEPAGEILLEVGWDDECIRARLVDHGRPFDPEAVPLPQMQQLPESGMGLFIIRSFVDRLEYRPGPPNEIVLTKCFRTAG